MLTVLASDVIAWSLFFWDSCGFYSKVDMNQRPRYKISEFLPRILVGFTNPTWINDQRYAIAECLPHISVGIQAGPTTNPTWTNDQDMLIASLCRSFLWDLCGSYNEATRINSLDMQNREYWHSRVRLVVHYLLQFFFFFVVFFDISWPHKQMLSCGGKIVWQSFQIHILVKKGQKLYNYTPLAKKQNE